ncbi:unnamed protein product [Diamesa serratosioi]
MRIKAFLLVLLISLGCIAVRGNESDDGVTVEEEIETVEVTSSPEEKVQYQSPNADSTKFYFAEHFDDLEKFNNKWVKSQSKKLDTDEDISKYDGVWAVEQPQRSILENDLGLVLKTKAKHAAISARFIRPFKFTEKPLIVQYEVTFQEGQECGGSYIKLLSAGKENNDLTKFNDKSPYTIMFGPDKCGNDIKLHMIFRHVNPINGSIEEKNAKKSKERLDEIFKDKQPHLYTLVLSPDNTYRISVDQKVVNEGSLLKDFTPAVNPPKDIDDLSDFKPESWDEREKIEDPTVTKPDNWDQPAQILDPNAVKPDGWLDDETDMIPDTTAEKPTDWDQEMDGEWEPPMLRNPLCEAVGCGEWSAPMIPNPEYKGKWRAPLLDNPNYQGKWSPRKIPNPDFFEDNHPFVRMTPIAGVGIELWSMSENILFDNIIVTDDFSIAQDWAEQTFDLKRKHLEKQAETFMQKLKNITNESPWIVALVVVVVGLPISVIMYMLCSASKTPEISTKKTDEPTQDDDMPEAEHSGRKSKSNLNMEPEEIAEQDEEAEATEEEEAEEIAPEPRVKTPAPTVEPAAKKRKPRKE